MLWLGAAALVIGLILLVLGFRGRRIDDHPLCRRCRFDLVGLQQGTARCPECGADLSTPRATRTGNRARRRGLLAAGVMLVLASLIPSGMVVYQLAKGRSANTLKPEWWLLRDLGSRKRGDAALQELDRRHLAGTLSKSGRLAAARRILARQADTSLPWSPTWGGFIEAAHADHVLPAADWAAYARNAAVFSIDARPIVRQGDGPAAILRVMPRAGPSYSLTFQARCSTLDIGGEDVAPGGWFTLNGILMSQALPWGAKPLHNCVFLPKMPAENFIHEYPQDFMSPDEPRDRPVLAAPGKHRLSGTWIIRVYDSTGIGTSGAGVTATWGWHGTPEPVGFQLEPTGPPVAEYTIELSAPVTVVPRETETVELVTDESLAGRMNSGITASLFREPGPPPSIQGTLSPTNLPVDVAADVMVVEGGKERKAGMVVLRAGAGATQTGLDLGNAGGGPVTFILRPNADLARKTLEVTRIWGKEIRMEDVQVAPNSPYQPVAPAPEEEKP